MYVCSVSDIQLVFALLFKYQWLCEFSYRMGTNFRGWLNFAVFEGTSQTAKNNPGEIFVRLRPRKNMCRCWARHASSRRRSFVNFVQPLTTEETLCVVFLRHHLFTDPRVPSYTSIIRKGRGNYTHNKSTKIKTYENLLIMMFQQKMRNFYPTKFCTHMVCCGMLRNLVCVLCHPVKWALVCVCCKWVHPTILTYGRFL